MFAQFCQGVIHVPFLLAKNYFHIIIIILLSLFSPASSQNHWNDNDAWVAKGGCWELKDSFIYARGYWRSCKFIYQPTYRDFVYKVRLAKVEETGAYSLLFRYNDEKDQGYEILVYPYSGVNFSILRGTQNELVRQGNSEHWRQGMNVWNTVRIESFGSVFVVDVNDERVFSYSDNKFSRGKLGLTIGGDPRQKAMFEILEITEK
ncbi:hypothetical protein JW998_03015 [candidate division KSB1 bacterium]|nr:hypothetical protein [candidate division KSB1 bacterium]